MACMLLFCCFVVRGQAGAPKVCLDSVRVRLERAARLDSTYFSEIDLSIGHLSIGELLRNIARVHGVNLCVKVDEGRMVTCNFNRARKDAGNDMGARTANRRRWARRES